MGTDVNEVVERLPSPRDVKVHRVMCTELMKLIDKIAKIFPEIEAARPRCLSGIQTLCLLNKAIEKAKLLLQYCSESSKLYMALTGDVIQSRFQKTGKLLEQSLSQIQNIVPVALAVEISRIISDLRGAKFSLDPHEEEAGKVVKTLLQHQAGSTKESESAIKAIEIAALRLQITSKKALLIETRSIKKLFDKLGDDEFAKKQILLFLLSMLKKYEKTIVRRQSESAHVQHEASILLENPCDPAVETESRIHHGPNEAQPDVLSRPMPPEEFKCPLSTRLMYDPVVIASGQTFERMWIQKWFDEGHLTCPNTKRKLAHLSLTPNTVMKDLISNWCAAYGVTIRDPHMQSAEVNSWETSSTSIASLSSSMNDLQIDFSHVSIGSLDTSHGSDDDFDRFQSSANKHDRDVEILRELDSLPWESQCKVVEDVSIHLKHDDQAWDVISPKKFVEPLVKFLKDALEMNDVKAQRTGCVVLLAFVSKCSSGIQNMHEDAYDLLVSFIDSEVTEEALAIMEVLSRYRYCRSKIAASNALRYITKMLDTERRFSCETAIKILYNFSLYNDLNILIVSSELIRKLVPFLEDDTLAIYSISILNKLCDNENAKVSVVETDGCISSVAKLLDSDSHEEQEHATGVFLSLCSQHDKYCKLVMDEGVIPALVDISANGNENGKIKAMELLRLLRDIKYDDVQECRGPNVDFYRDFTYQVKEKKTSSTVSGFFGKISKFSKKGFSAPRIQK